MRPPELIRLEEILLRRLARADAEAHAAAIRANLDHLRSWLPWSANAPTVEGLRDGFLARAEAAWESGQDYAYGIWTAAETELIGGAGLHNRLGPDALEIGYWLAARHTGRGYARAAARALTEAALALPGIKRVEIHCDEANHRSAAVPRALGYRLDRIEPDGIRAPAESGRGMIWIYEPPQPTRGGPAGSITAP